VTISRKTYYQDWRRKNANQVREYNRRYYHQNLERCREANRLKQRRWREANPDKNKCIKLRYKFGITKAHWDKLFLEQGQRCAGCGSDEPGWKHDWHVDHCHKTLKVRGILCHHCNTILGRAKDNPTVLRHLADYLESNQEPDA